MLCETPNSGLVWLFSSRLCYYSLICVFGSVYGRGVEEGKCPQKPKMPDPGDLDLQVAMSCLETELGGAGEMA